MKGALETDFWNRSIFSESVVWYCGSSAASCVTCCDIIQPTAKIMRKAKVTTNATLKARGTLSLLSKRRGGEDEAEQNRESERKQDISSYVESGNNDCSDEQTL